MLIFKRMKDTCIYVRHINVDFFSFPSCAQPSYLLLQHHSLCVQIMKPKPIFVWYISFSFLSCRGWTPTNMTLVNWSSYLSWIQRPQQQQDSTASLMVPTQYQTHLRLLVSRNLYKNLSRSHTGWCTASRSWDLRVKNLSQFFLKSS